MSIVVKLVNISYLNLLIALHTRYNGWLFMSQISQYNLDYIPAQESLFLPHFQPLLPQRAQASHNSTHYTNGQKFLKIL